MIARGGWSLSRSFRENARHGGASTMKTPTLSRRAALMTVSIVARAPSLSLAAEPLSVAQAAEPLSVVQAITRIRAECDPAFISAVQETGRSLYRGEAALGAAASLLNPTPDLLQLDTYGSTAARRYFQELEAVLAEKSAARPSTGHIAVSNLEAAAQWGAAASIWPLGQPVHYVWPKRRSNFWPLQYDDGRRDSIEAYHVDVNLADALRLGREVLFAAGGDARGTAVASAYIAISASADDEVRERLTFGRASVSARRSATRA